MSGADLFEELAEQPAPKPATSPGAPRVQEPRRDEPSWQVVDLDALIALDHPARLVWSFVTSLELGELYASIKACTHTVGRTPIEPDDDFATLSARLEETGVSYSIRTQERMVEVPRDGDLYTVLRYLAVVEPTPFGEQHGLERAMPPEGEGYVIVLTSLPSRAPRRTGMVVGS